MSKVDPVVKFFEEIFNCAVEEEEHRLRTQELRVKMLRKIRDRLPALWRELNEPVKPPKGFRLLKPPKVKP